MSRATASHATILLLLLIFPAVEEHLAGFRQKKDLVINLS